ncbi:MAG: c-type heme family protein [Elainellaceae cyanobacterium]
MRWKLGTKFSLGLVLVFLLVSGVTVLSLSKHLHYQAEQAVKERAAILLTTMQAARNYTQDNIQPMLERNPGNVDSFIKESVPNFAAQAIFSDFRRQAPEFQDFLYKEAAPNPTNPDDLADAFESKIFTQLQQLTETNPEMLSGYRTLGEKTLFYLARPLVMRDVSCLACHGRPSQAPKQLIEMYGNQNGFGWKLNDVIAAQMMYVPADRILNQGQQNLLTVTKTLLSFLAALFCMVNLLLWRTVTQPLKILTHVAQQISSYSLNHHQRVPNQDQGLDALMIRQDEPGQLARAFQYMVYVLSQREQDLKQAVQERTQSLEQEMVERQAAQETLQTYAHAMNHDLRNLVMGISMLVQGVLFHSSETDQEATQKDGKAPPFAIEVPPMALTMIQKSCDRQLRLMNSLMELQSRDLWRTALQLETVNLRQLTDALITTHQAKLQASTATLDNQIANDLPRVQADPNQLQRVFENLVDNALKYNPKGVEITLKATVCDGAASRFENRTIRCAVADNGIGVDSRKSRELFKMYARGYDNYEASGYGLGLYICQKIVEAHGGEIGVITRPNGGAEFWFTLPSIVA